MSESTEMEARIRRLEDLEAIHQLLMEYARHIDDGDLAAYASLFAREGELLLGPVGVIKGRHAIRTTMEKHLSGQLGERYHIISNPVVHLQSDERASAEDNWAVIERAEGDRPSVIMVGRHADTLAREDGRWCFLRREVHYDIPKR